MRQLINGREYEIPTHSDGTIDVDTLRRIVGIPGNRALVMQNNDGTNQVVNPGQRLRVNPRQQYSDMPVHKRGTQRCLIARLDWQMI